MKISKPIYSVCLNDLSADQSVSDTRISRLHELIHARVKSSLRFMGAPPPPRVTSFKYSYEATKIKHEINHFIKWNHLSINVKAIGV